MYAILVREYSFFLKEDTWPQRTVGFKTTASPIAVILPQLVVPYWSFDPAREQDHLIGKALWAGVEPSLRSLRVVIQYASTLADMTGKKRINADLLKQSYQMVPIQKNQKELELNADDQEGEDESPTEYERESERRHCNDHLSIALLAAIHLHWPSLKNGEIFHLLSALVFSYIQIVSKQTSC